MGLQMWTYCRKAAFIIVYTFLPWCTCYCQKLVFFPITIQARHTVPRCHCEKTKCSELNRIKKHTQTRRHFHASALVAEMFIKKETRNAPWLILRPSSAFKVTQRDAHALRLMSAETSWTAQAGVRDSWTKPISIGIDRSVLQCKIGQKSLRQLNKEQQEKEGKRQS